MRSRAPVHSFLDRYGDPLRLALERAGRDRPPAAGFEPAFALPEASSRLDRYFAAADLRFAELDTVGRTRLVLLDLMGNPATRTVKTLTALVTVARAVAHVERTGEPVVLLAQCSANRATALRDAVQRALVLGLARPDQLQVVALVPEPARPKLWSSLLAEDPRLAARNPVGVLGREHPQHVRALARDAVAAEEAELAARYGVRLWHASDPADARCADAVRALAEHAELPPVPGVTRTHAHAVAGGDGLLGHHLGTTMLPAAAAPRHFAVQHLAAPELVGGLHDSSVPDYRLDGATGLHHQRSDPRYPATTYDPLESVDPSFAGSDPATTAELTELLRRQGGGGVVVSLHECLERYPRVRSLLELGGVDLPADPRALREWSLVMVMTGVLVGLERGLLDSDEVVVHGSGSYGDGDYTPLAARALHRVGGIDDLRRVLRAAVAGAAVTKVG